MCISVQRAWSDCRGGGGGKVVTSANYQALWLLHTILTALWLLHTILTVSRQPLNVQCCICLNKALREQYY